MLYRYSRRIFLAVVTAALAVPVWAAAAPGPGPLWQRAALAAAPIRPGNCQNQQECSGDIALPPLR